MSFLTDIWCCVIRDLLNSVMLTVKESAAEVKIAASAVRDVVQQGNGMTEKQLAQHLQQSMYSTCIFVIRTS